MVSFSATFANLLNQHSVTAYQGELNSTYASMGITPPALPGSSCIYSGDGLGCFIVDGPAFYAAAENPWNLSQNLNSGSLFTGGGPVTINSQYGKPLFYQNSRTVRLGLKFTF